jgi:hypothetical protein
MMGGYSDDSDAHITSEYQEGFYYRLSIFNSLLVATLSLLVASHPSTRDLSTTFEEYAPTVELFLQQ